MVKTQLDKEAPEAADAQSVSVNILGREYKIRGVADPAYVEEVAAFVDTRMREIARGTATPAPDRVAILAAINIADELLQLRRSGDDELQSIERRTQNLIRLLDERLAEDI